MASISSKGAKGHHTYKLTLTETSTSIEKNESYVNYSFDLTDDANWFWSSWGSLITYSISANGSVIKSGSIPNHTTKNQNIASGSFTVPHNADGTKSIAYSFSVTDGAGQYYTSGNASASGTMTLTTIPRATTPTVSATSVTMGGSVTITMTPATSGFKHKLRYDFGNLKGQTSGLSIGADFTAAGTTTATFTPPTSLANQIPSANSGVCTIYCYTYNSSGTQIGSTVSKTITLNVPSYTLTGSVALTGNNLLNGAYVQGKSTVKAVITAETSYGATIKSYSSVIDGKTYSGSTFTTSALSNGSKSVSVTIMDSRNKTHTFTSSAITVYPYSAPYITIFNVERQSDGTTVVASIAGGVSAVNNKNTKTFKITLNGVTNTLTSSGYTINGSTTFTNVPTDSTLAATATIADSYTSVTKTAVLPTVAVTMDFHYSGKGIALGKVAEEENLFEVDWKTRLKKHTSVEVSEFEAFQIKRTGSTNAAAIRFANENGKLGYIGMTNEPNGGLIRWKADTSGNYIILDTGNTADYVIEQGTTDGWEYTKWKNGKMELFSAKSLTFPEGTKQTDYLYRSIVSLDLSKYLTKIMSGTCCVQINGMVPQLCRHSTNLATAEIVIVTSRTIPVTTVTAPIYVIGKWK